MNFTPEQLAYLKSLESPEKRRKFMLDCLVENALGESVKSVKISELPFYFPFQTSTAPETLKAIDYGDFINDEKLIHNWHEKQLDEYNKKQREAQEVFYDKMKSIISENNQSANEESKLVGLLKTCGYSEAGNNGVDLSENLYEIKDSAIILDNVENYDIRQFGHLFIRINGNFHSAYVRTIGNNLKIDTANKIEDGAYEVFVVEGNKIVPFVKNDQSAKPNYSPEEIEIAKSLNSEREGNKEIVKDEKFRRTVDAIKYIKGYFPYFCFESKTDSLKVINSAFDYFKDTYFVVEFDIQEGKEKMIQLNCKNVPKEAFDEIEKKWTDNDMERAFIAGNMATIDCFITPYVTLDTEAYEISKAKYLKAKSEYLKSLKND